MLDIKCFYHRWPFTHGGGGTGSKGAALCAYGNVVHTICESMFAIMMKDLLIPINKCILKRKEQHWEKNI
jgi:hypothetical protein